MWIYNVSSTKWTQLDPTTIPYLNQHFPNWLNNDSSLPRRYSLDGDIITLNPKASSTYAGTNYLKLFYFKRSIDMSDDSHYPFSGSTTQYPHLAAYEETLVDYVRYRVKKILKKDASAEEAKTMFYSKCTDIKTKLKYRPDLIQHVRAEGAGNLLFHNQAYKNGAHTQRR